jgi:VanZ family protein
VALSPRQRSSAAPLALVYAALLLYASLYPFAGWRWPPGTSLGALLVLPWPPWRTPFDVWSNMLGYLPLGALLYVAQVRAGRSGWHAALLVLAAASVLSYGTEVVQQFLPRRVPSRVDWALNSAGAAAGIALAALLHALGLLQRWQALRERWFLRDSAGALSLLALWPVALLFPTPVPLGVGHVAPPLREAAIALLDGVPWATRLLAALQDAHAAGRPLPPLSDGLVQLLGLLAPCLLGASAARPGGRRALLVAGVLRHHLVHAVGVRPGERARLGDAADGAGTGPRPVAGAGLHAAAGAGCGRAGPGGTGRTGGAGEPGAGGSVLRRQPAGLGAGPLRALPWPGAMDRLVVALCGDDLAAEPAGIAHRAVRACGGCLQSRPRCRARPERSA